MASGVAVRFAASRPLVRVSLRTALLSEAKLRQAEVAAFFAALWGSLRRTEPARLTHRQCVALAGDLFRAWIAEDATAAASLAADEGEARQRLAVSGASALRPALWHAAAVCLSGLDGEHGYGAATAEALGPCVDHALWDRGILAVDLSTRSILLIEFRRALHDAFAVQARQSAGDYSPPPEASRFPEWEPVVRKAEAPKLAAGKVSLLGLVDKWWAEAEAAGRSRSTHDSYAITIKHFGAFLGHDEARRVSNGDVIRYKDHRLASGISAKTIQDRDLVGLKAVFEFAYTPPSRTRTTGSIAGLLASIARRPSSPLQDPLHLHRAPFSTPGCPHAATVEPRRQFP